MFDLYTAMIAACEGVEVVFHMAAPDSSINNHKLHYSVNVQGYYFLPPTLAYMKFGFL